MTNENPTMRSTLKPISPAARPADRLFKVNARASSKASLTSIVPE